MALFIGTEGIYKINIALHFVRAKSSILHWKADIA
jgi:hypothetical protein